MQGTGGATISPAARAGPRRTAPITSARPVRADVRSGWEDEPLDPLRDGQPGGAQRRQGSGSGEGRMGR